MGSQRSRSGSQPCLQILRSGCAAPATQLAPWCLMESVLQLLQLLAARCRDAHSRLGHCPAAGLHNARDGRSSKGRVHGDGGATRMRGVAVGLPRPRPRAGSTPRSARNTPRGDPAATFLPGCVPGQLAGVHLVHGLGGCSACVRALSLPVTGRGSVQSGPRGTHAPTAKKTSTGNARGLMSTSARWLSPAAASAAAGLHAACSWSDAGQAGYLMTVHDSRRCGSRQTLCQGGSHQAVPLLLGTGAQHSRCPCS